MFAGILVGLMCLWLPGWVNHPEWKEPMVNFTTNWLKPIGVFCLMANVVAVNGPMIIGSLALIIGVDKIFDMGRTTLNITGDATCAIWVSRLEQRKAARKAAKQA